MLYFNNLNVENPTIEKGISIRHLNQSQQGSLKLIRITKLIFCPEIRQTVKIECSKLNRNERLKGYN